MKNIKNLSLITFIAVLLCGCTHHLYVSSLERDGYKGSIKSISERNYSALKKNDSLVKGYWLPAHSGLQEYKELFNKKGNSIEKVSYYAPDSIEEKRVFKTDKYGNIVRAYVYKPDGRLYDIISSKYTYDKQGNTLSEVQTDYLDRLIAKIKYKYDSKGNCVEEIWCDPCDSCCNDIYISTYDDNGNCIETVNHTPGENHKTIFTYDKNDNVIEKIWYIGNDTIGQKFTYQYIYDEKGNWVQKIVTEYEKTIIVERTYEYYE